MTHRLVYGPAYRRWVAADLPGQQCRVIGWPRPRSAVVDGQRLTAPRNVLVELADGRRLIVPRWNVRRATGGRG